MAPSGDSDHRSDEELASLTPQTRPNDWAASTGELHDVLRTPGTHVGPYIVLEQLGLGGMGVVYSAYDPKLDRKIALKVLRSQGHDEGAAVARLRLVSEGRALARVSHPNVVAVYDVGSLDSEVYVAMELIEGHTLGQWRKAARRDWPEVVDMFVDIAAGLVAVHDASLVHRDVKPDNILIDGEGRPKVTDFGLARPEQDTARSLRQREDVLRDANVPDEHLQLTQTGARLGTPAYMACEQLNGNPATPHSDQFALCVTLWETLYGERPFEGGSWVSLVMSVTEGQIREPPTPPSGRPVPGWLRRVVERGLAPDPEDRWPDMRALREALRGGDPLRVQRRRWLGAGAVAVTLAVAGGVQWQDTRARTAAEQDCAHQADAAAQLWSDTARERLREAYRSSALDDATAIGSSVEAVFDDYTRAWAEQRQEVCLARLDPAPPPLLGRREQCLDQGLATLGTMLETFSSGQDLVLSRSRLTAEDLADLERCTDTERLERMQPLPSDAQIRDRVTGLLRTLSSTLVHEHVGDYEEGLRISQEALHAALDLGHAPALAEAHYRVAVFHEKQGNYESAVEHWITAFREASLGGDDDLAAQSAGALAFAEGYQLGRHDTGIRWSQLAGILLEKLGKTNTLDEARRLDVLAVLTESKGDYDEAVTLHQRSLTLRESLVPPTHQSIGYGLANLAGVLQNLGRLEEAEQALLRSRSIFESAFGPDNPTTAHVLNNLAVLYHEQGRHPEARALQQRVLSNWTKRLGPDHPDVGDVHRALGDTALAQNDVETALKHYQDALTVHEKAEGDGQRTAHAKSALDLATALTLAERNDEAKRRFDAALEALAGLTDADRLRGRAHLGLGWLAFEQDQRQTARVHFERARGHFEGSESSKHWSTRTDIALAAVGPEDAALSQWRAVADDDAHPGFVRAEALAWIVRTEQPAHEADRTRLEALLQDASAEHRLRIRHATRR